MTFLNSLAQLTSHYAATVLPASGMASVSSEEATTVPLEQSAAAFRQLVDSQRTEDIPMRVRLWGGGLPMFVGLSLEEMASIVVVAGVATLLVRGMQKFWEIQTKPFGDLTSLNRIFHDWAVVDEGDARAHAERIGRAFLKEVKRLRDGYETKYFLMPYTISPQKWAQMTERRHRLTADYARSIVATFQQFAGGLARMSRRDFGDVYQEVFGHFMQQVFLAMGPVTRWEDPPMQEDIDNFNRFQKVLRQEIMALEMKLRELSEPHAV